MLPILLTYVFLFMRLFLGQAAMAQSDTLAKDTVIAGAKIKVPKPDSVKYWKNEGNCRLNFRNVTLRNWNAGGNSNIALGSEVRLAAVRTKDQETWSNHAIFAYGLINEANADFPWKKNDDRILITSIYSQCINDR